MINENLKLSGQLSIVLKDKAGNVKEQRDVKNLVVNSRNRHRFRYSAGVTRSSGFNNDLRHKQ